uniref:Plasmolipin n=1 Tax=Ursus americanus TaxID=9643 RepID=A0A452RHH9_URSAM
MAEFPMKMSTETSCPWQGAGASLSPLCLDPGFFCSRLLIFNVGTTVLDILAFITCSTALELTSLKGTLPSNQWTAAFLCCLVMIAYGASAFFSFQAWQGVGRNAATSQMAGGYTWTTCSIAHLGAKGCSQVPVWGGPQARGLRPLWSQPGRDYTCSALLIRLGLTQHS